MKQALSCGTISELQQPGVAIAVEVVEHLLCVACPISQYVFCCRFNIAAHPDVQLRILNELSGAGLLFSPNQVSVHQITGRDSIADDNQRLLKLPASRCQVIAGW